MKPQKAYTVILSLDLLALKSFKTLSSPFLHLSSDLPAVVNDRSLSMKYQPHKTNWE